MYSLSKDVKEQLIEYYNKQESLVKIYKNENNLEMAYLTKWTILEKFIKLLTFQKRKIYLANDLKAWLKYLEIGGKKPVDISKFSIECPILPQEKEFKEVLNNYGFDCEKAWNIMKSTGSHRKYRNKLAHDGERISERQFSKLFVDLEGLVEYFFNGLSQT